MFFRHALALTITYVASWGAALAQGYPAKPIRLIIASAAGGSTDTIGRTVGDGMVDALGQPVVHDNRAGAGGIVAGDLTARAAPDGYTFLLATTAGIAVSGNFYKTLPYDPIKDFAPIVLVATQPYVMVVNPAVANSVSELIARARAKPGQITFGSTGIGTSSHLAGEFLKNITGIDILHVPYKSMSAAMIDVASGRASLAFGSHIATVSLVKSGRLKALAVTSATRSSGAPELPTLDEAGVRGYALENWYGLLAPARTPLAIVNRINAIANKTLSRAEVKERMARDGTSAMGGTSAEFGMFINTEIVKWAKLLKSAGIVADK